MNTTAPVRTRDPITNSHDLYDRGVDPSFIVIAWPDPLIDERPDAIATASDELLWYWLPGIGPTAALMAHRLATYAAQGPSSWTLTDMAATFGIGAGRCKVRGTLDRLARFGIIRRTGTTIAVRLWLPPLTARQREQLPGYLAAAYDAR